MALFTARLAAAVRDPVLVLASAETEVAALFSDWRHQRQPAKQRSVPGRRLCSIASMFLMEQSQSVKSYSIGQAICRGQQRLVAAAIGLEPVWAAAARSKVLGRDDKLVGD
jgi:hypothetical protein